MTQRLLDCIFALFWLILTAPISLIVAILIKLDSPGPVLYTPLMIGKSGKPFRLFRFRTMISDSTAQRSAEQRLTRVGRFVRNYSLDHLPMLFNLLTGDLTIVGPRPMEVAVVDLQVPTWQQYFRVKPGIINYAVLKMGKTWTPSRTTKPEINQELEMEYIQRRSTLFDLRLFLRAMRALFVSKGNIKARGEPDRDE